MAGAKFVRVNFDLEQKLHPENLDKMVEDAENRLRNYFLNKVSHDEHKAQMVLRTKFGQADWNASGTVDLKEFSVLVSSLNITNNGQVIQELFDRYDTDDSGDLKYREFCASLFGQSLIPIKKPGVSAAIKKVRQKLLERGADSVRGLGRVFRLMDTDRDNKKEPKISQAEFCDGLTRYGLDLSQTEMLAVAKAFDRDGNGITQTEFMVALRGKLNDRRRELVTLAFKQLDKDKTGVVEFAEIRRIYDATRHPDVLEGRMTVDDVLRVFIASWDRDGDGTITLLEFIDYYKDLSCLIQEDDYFELMIRNAWHLAGGKGWSANTSNLRVLVTHGDGSEEVVCILNDLGLDSSDDAALRAALEDQGVTDIKTVSTSM